MSTNVQPTSRRNLRLGLVLVLVIMSTALIGFGGLALWTAVTENGNSQFSTAAVHHSNAATITGGTTVTCNDVSSPTACGAIFSVTGATPGFSQQVGTVTITNTSTVTSNFLLNLKSAVVSGTGSGTTLCSSLQLTVRDNEPGSPVLYTGSLASLPPQALKTSTGSPAWNTGAADTFFFTLSLPATSPSSDQDSTCTAAFQWQQTSS